MNDDALQDKNGKPIKVGDYVIGQGRNSKHPIMGPVVSLYAAQSDADITVAYASATMLEDRCVPQLALEHCVAAEMEVVATHA